MSMTAAADRTSSRPAADEGIRRRRALAHLAGATLVLLAVATWVGTDASYTMDESAYILQAQRLADGRGWITPDPLPTIDPDGRFTYEVLSDRGPAGTAVYAKHPAYPVLLAGLDRLGGQTAMVLASVLGTVLSAYVAGRMAARFDERLEPWTIWATAIGSPLLFDSQLVVAHTLTTAACAGALLTVVRLGERWTWGRVAVVAALAAAASALRSEAVLFGVALAAWLAWTAWRSRAWRPGAAAVAVGAATVATMAADRWAAAHIIGGRPAVVNPAGSEAGGYLDDRISGAVQSLLDPGPWSSATQVALLVLVTALMAVGVLARRDAADQRLVVGLTAIAVIAGVVTAAGPAGATIPSLTIACPLIVLGLVALGRDERTGDTGRAVLVVSGLFTAAVLATQYGEAGGTEWGARYLSPIVPGLVAVAVAAIARAASQLPARAGHALVASVAVVSMLVAVLAVRSLRVGHDAARELTARLTAVAEATPGPDLGGGDRRPIVVSTWWVVGRITGPTGPDVRGLTIEPPEDLGVVTGRLADAGVDRFVLVRGSEGDLAHAGGCYRAVPAGPDDRIVIMERVDAAASPGPCVPAEHPGSVPR